MDVIGIGTVEIPIKRSPNLSGTAAHGSLILENVLHVPSAMTNGIGQPLVQEGYTVQFGSNSNKSMGAIKDPNGKNVAYFDPEKKLYNIKLRNSPGLPPLGPSMMRKGENEDKIFLLGFSWPAEERENVSRFLSQQPQEADVTHIGAANAQNEQPSNNDKPYTDAEKAFLKQHYGGEYKFLMSHGLNIHKEEQREEGRQILHALMQDEEQVEDDDGSEFDFAGHQADYNFTHKQLDWIEKHYKNSENFMISYGLKFYDNDDLKEAKAIAEAMMRDDD